MKAKFTLITFLFISMLTYGQTPINAYFDYSSNGNQYTILDVATPLDQTTAGANVIWNFDQFTSIGTSIGTNAVPTAAEVTTFPNTTTVSSVVSTTIGAPSTNKIYSETTGTNAVSLTGFVTADVNLNYVTNNALLGTFPLTYGYNFTDTTAGTWISGAYSGTFTGTMTTSVDAYGTLNINDTGNGAYSGAVTRLKTVQNINLIYGIFSVGTVVMTTYGYVDASNTAQFRFSEIVANIPLLGVVNQTVTSMEDFDFMLLANHQNELTANGLSLSPNPATDFFTLKTTDIATEITITDSNGREVARQNNNIDKIAIAHLQKGIYFVNITTDKGTFTQKLVKE